MRFLRAGLILLIVVLTACGDKPSSSAAVESKPDWQSNFEQAKAKAKAENKKLLIDFTGEGWCPPCLLLSKEVFNTPEFTEYAAKNLVLLKLVYLPFGPDGLNGSPENVKIAQQFNVQAFPTVLILSPQGEVVGGTGYSPGGVKPFLEGLRSLP